MKKTKIIIFILMILSSMAPIAGVIIPMKMGTEPSRAASIGIIGGAYGPTSVFIASPRIKPFLTTSFAPPIVLFIVWLILHIKTRKKKQEEGEL